MSCISGKTNFITTECEAMSGIINGNFNRLNPDRARAPHQTEQEHDADDMIIFNGCSAAIESGDYRTVLQSTLEQQNALAQRRLDDTPTTNPAISPSASTAMAHMPVGTTTPKNKFAPLPADPPPFLLPPKPAKELSPEERGSFCDWLKAHGQPFPSRTAMDPVQRQAHQAGTQALPHLCVPTVLSKWLPSSLLQNVTDLGFRDVWYGLDEDTLWLAQLKGLLNAPAHAALRTLAWVRANMCRLFVEAWREITECSSYQAWLCEAIIKDSRYARSETNMSGEELAYCLQSMIAVYQRHYALQARMVKLGSIIGLPQVSAWLWILNMRAWSHNLAQIRLFEHILAPSGFHNTLPHPP
ncbi:hypothetical protein CALCODRAFT_484231 [Calocera cornea HHB12733]|uniref:Uncharacterized protein n=1 Tax=Calocera cornea HHB12733 TaxID=1353952 RepID=A0A165F3G6_9BASI|nr:hypothetical protein CALCODRAFT_484231 [Calocera cornea HHB12733]